MSRRGRSTLMGLARRWSSPSMVEPPCSRTLLEGLFHRARQNNDGSRRRDPVARLRLCFLVSGFFFTFQKQKREKKRERGGGRERASRGKYAHCYEQKGLV